MKTNQRHKNIAQINSIKKCTQTKPTNTIEIKEN